MQDGDIRAQKPKKCLIFHMCIHINNLENVERAEASGLPLNSMECDIIGYALKAGQLTYDCRYSTMHGMPVTGGRGFRGMKPLWYNSVPP